MARWKQTERQTERFGGDRQPEGGASREDEGNYLRLVSVNTETILHSWKIGHFCRCGLALKGENKEGKQ